MRRTGLLCHLIVGLFAVSPLVGNTASQTTFRYSPADPSGFTIITHDDQLPVIDYVAFQYGIESIEATASLPVGVLAEIITPNGVVTSIASGSTDIAPFQAQEFFPVANTCDADELSTGFPYAVLGSDLPYEVSFDTTAASDSGDFRGGAADGISRPGGNDGFILFTPTESGTYFLTNSATKGDFAPIPDHEFERGFGSIGVWQGSCADGLTEVGIANSILGDSELAVSLEAGVTYVVVWEDFFVGSTENSITITIDFLGTPVGNTLQDSINLTEEGWGFDIVADTTPNQNLVDSECVEGFDPTGHGGGSAGVTGAEIWYRLPAATPGAEYTVSIESASEDTPFVDSALMLHAYSLETHTVSAIACNQDISEENRLSSITFVAEPMRIYYIMAESVIAFDQPPFGTFRLVGTAAETTVPHWTLH